MFRNEVVKMGVYIPTEVIKSPSLGVFLSLLKCIYTNIMSVTTA